jgi:hypothetical protein
MGHVMEKRFWSRRELLNRVGGGMGALAFADLMRGAESGSSSVNPFASRQPHFAAKAKAVISIFCYGGVSQVDTFDPKPELQRRAGEALVGKGEVKPSQGTPGALMPALWEFKKHGQCGMDVSELFPHVARHVDEIAFIRSMRCLSNDHAPALYQMNTGFILPGHPSMGSWITYGLGTENQNLPSFVVFTDWRGGPIGGAPNWGNGFMPAAYQGTQFRSMGDPIVDLKPRGAMTPERQRRWLDLLGKLNEEHLRQHPEENELTARMAAFELAFRMQNSAPEATDLNSESEITRKLYGIDQKETEYVGRQCLMARRLVERGVRYVQIFSGGGNFTESWDAHFELKHNHSMHAKETDQPISALLTDLKARGLWNDVLVIWHGEFGRMPISQRVDGRDHNPYAFAVWMAGAGVKGGSIVGQTDEFGYRVAENPKTVNDLHATILHLMGLDHTRLTYPHNGRQMRLTDVSGELIREVLA